MTMTSSNQSEALHAILDRLGLVVPAADIPFLLRAYQRQRQVVDSWRNLLAPQTEPAHVFGVSRSPAGNGDRVLAPLHPSISETHTSNTDTIRPVEFPNCLL